MKTVRMISKFICLLPLAASTVLALSFPAPPATQKDLVAQGPWVALDPWWGFWQFEFNGDGTGKCSWTRPEMPVYTYEVTHTRLKDNEIRFICIPIFSTHGAQNFVGWTTQQRLFLKSVDDKREFPVTPARLLDKELLRIRTQNSEPKK